MAAANSTQEKDLTFAEACAALSLSPAEMAVAREHGLVVCHRNGSRQRYPQAPLRLTEHLIRIGKEYGWRPPTVCWYADLLFGAQVGRTILVPVSPAGAVPQSMQPVSSWLETPLAATILRDLVSVQPDHPMIANTLRIIVAATLVAGQFWPDLTALEQSALYPIVQRAETNGVPIIERAREMHWEAGQNLLGFLQAFTAIAPPLAVELRRLVAETQARLSRVAPNPSPVPVGEQELIEREHLIAVDRLYATHATEIHSAPDRVETSGTLMVIPRRTIALQLDLNDISPDKQIIDNVVDVVRPYLGPFGARVILALYEIANDSPYYRQPVIHIETNDLLDRLGLQRDRRGIHYTRNRMRLRDTLTAAHNLEIVGEHTVIEGGKSVRRAFQQTVLSLIGGDFDADETRGIPTSDLFRKGLPRTMMIRLNMYAGIRGQDGQLGQLGRSYVLMPRLASPAALPSAKHAATPERLKTALLLRARQTRLTGRIIHLTRAQALEAAGIRDSNITRATQALDRALRRLMDEGFVAEYEPIPLGRQEAFTVTLAAQDPAAAAHGQSTPPGV